MTQHLPGRLSLALILLAVSSPILAQWTQDCQTPAFPASGTASAMQLRADGDHTMYYATVDSLALKIYSSPCTTTPLYTYSFNATERTAIARSAFPGWVDFTGDGIFEIYVLLYYSTPRYRWAFKILNVVNGSTVFERSDNNLSCSSYPYWTADLDGDGDLDCPVLIGTAAGTQHCEIYSTGVSASGSAGGPPVMPRGFALEQNAPNPFNPATRIEYTLAAPGHVKVEVFDLLGRPAATLVDGPEGAGTHTVRWNSTDGAGTPLPSGAYFYQLSINGTPQGARQMLLLR